MGKVLATSWVLLFLLTFIAANLAPEQPVEWTPIDRLGIVLVCLLLLVGTALAAYAVGGR